MTVYRARGWGATAQATEATGRGQEKGHGEKPDRWLSEGFHHTSSGASWSLRVLCLDANEFKEKETWERHLYSDNEGFIILQTEFAFLCTPYAKFNHLGGCPVRCPLWSLEHTEKAGLYSFLLEHMLSDFRAKHCFHKDIKKFLPSLPSLKMPFFWHWLTRTQFKVST